MFVLYHRVDEPETRDAWWAELRTEIRSHMRAMGCHAVIGYSEHTFIRDELIVLSATGTAALVNLNITLISQPPGGGGRLLVNTGPPAGGGGGR